jgi:hypothetical protein
MVNLQQYYNEEKWTVFFQHIVPTELEKNMKFYNYLVELNLFSSDINKVLASLFDYMFFGKKENFDLWLNKKHKMLDNNTPIERIKKIDGEKTLKVYLMRYPII